MYLPAALSWIENEGKILDNKGWDECQYEYWFIINEVVYKHDFPEWMLCEVFTRVCSGMYIPYRRK